MMWKKGLFYLLSALVLIIPAFYNGYPLVYSDTGTYIMSGMEFVIPCDRPIMYGLFIRLCSLKISLWFVIYIQSLLLTYILWHFSKLFYSKISRLQFLLLLLFLCWFTGAGWYTSQIMPDIFTPMALLCMGLLLFKKSLKTHQYIIFSVCVVFAIDMHFSIFFISVLTLLALFIGTKTRFLSSVKTEIYFFMPTVLLALSILIISITNYAIARTGKINQGGHVFLMGKMLDSGVLKSFLDDKCSDNNYSLCSYKDSLPANSRVFMWDSSSPLAKSGGWQKTENEYHKIIQDIFKSPKHLLMYLFNCATSTATQLFQNDMGSGLIDTWYKEPDSPPYSVIYKYFFFEKNQYLQSRQNINLWGQGLDFSFINHIYNSFLIIGVLVLLVLFSKKMIDVKKKFLVCVLLLTIFFNAAITASLAVVCDRFQSRVSWLLIYICLLILFENRVYIQKRFQVRTK
ncbi:MAG: hypothetical protein JST67_00480 [Bacteroidetes bacterium]|nr:hypothetical protein [Bacteroidota bacterium]